MTVTIKIGDVRDKLAEISDDSVHCVVTSPPYWGLRCYGVEGQLGLEPTLGEHIQTMVNVFREVWRVLRKDGTVWLNYGDCYNAHPGQRKETDAVGAKQRSNRGSTGTPSRNDVTLKPKDLCMIPNRLAIALQDEGWWVRSEIIWHKPNPMPESVTDRPATAHEKVWLLSKSARYHYDAEAVRVPHKEPWRSGTKDNSGVGYHSGDLKGDVQWSAPRLYNENGANLRNVWTIATAPFSEAHFATFPPKLAEMCIKAGTSEKGCCAECGAPWVREVERFIVNDPGRGVNAKRFNNLDRNDNKRRLGAQYQKQLDSNPRKTLDWSPSCECVDSDGSPLAPIPCTVLDPFVGSGTTALVADRLGRDCIGIELNPEYAAMALRRIESDAGLFADADLEGNEGRPHNSPSP